MNRQQVSFTTVVLCSLLLSFLHCPFFEIFFDDKEIFKYTGLAISKGAVPYRDFFDHKPPLIYFLNYIGLLFGGWGLWLFDAAFVLIASIVFFRICKKQRLIFPWLPPILFNLLLRDQFVSFGIGMTREYSTVLLLLFFCCTYGNSKWKYYLLGLYTGLIFFLQQDQVLIVAPFAFFAIFWQSRRRAGWPIQLLKFSAGSLLIPALLIGYFAYQQALQPFWEDAFLFNFRWYNHSPYSFLEILKDARNRLHGTSYEIPFYTTMILGISSFVFGNRRSPLLIACIAALTLSFCAIFISGKLREGVNTIYYFLPLAATIPATLFVIWVGDYQASFSNYKISTVLAAILLLQPALGAIQYATHLPRHRWQLADDSRELVFFKTQELKDHDLYVAFNANEVYLYNELRILAPSKWIYHFFWTWFPAWDENNQLIQSITDDLKKHRTKFIIDYSGDNFLFQHPATKRLWDQFLNDNYSIDSSITPGNGRGLLWRIKPATP